MRAALQTGIRTIEVRDVPKPPSSPETALIRVRQTGICGSDLHPYHERAEPESVPRGHEVCGEVLELPVGYAGPVRVGNLVAVDGVYGTACGDCAFCRAGQMFHCRVRQSTPSTGGGFGQLIRRRPAGLFTLPSGFTPELGALVEPLAVGVHGVRYPKMQPGATVVVIGAGTIGLATLIAARGLGAGAIHVTARHPHQASMAAELGATTVLPDDPTAAAEQVRALTGGLGADLVVETVGGHADTLNLAWELVRPQGTVSVLGVFPSRVPVDLLRPLQNEVWVTFPVCYGVVDGRHDYEVAIDLMARGKAPIEKLVTARFPLESAPEAFRVAADKSTGSLKVHVVVS